MSHSMPVSMRALLCATLGLGCGSDPKGADNEPEDPQAAVPECLTSFSWTADATNPPSSVSIVGDFNDWEIGVDALVEVQPGVWEGELPLPAGHHIYRIAERYEWSQDAYETTTCDPNSELIQCPDGYKEPWDTQWEMTCGPGTESACSSFIVVADCSVPQLTLDAINVDRAARSAQLTVQGTPGTSASSLAEATVTLDGTPVTASWSDTTLSLNLSDLSEGRHTVRVTTTDDAGGTSEMLHVPFWTDAVGDDAFAAGSIYFAFVDRLANGDPSNDAPQGATDPLGEYQGGDYQGLIDLLPYLDDLGVRTLWLSNPQDNAEGAWDGDCSSSYTGYHAYWPDQARAVEEHFGDSDLLHELVDKAHSLQMRVIVDWVANHVHQDHPYASNSPEWFFPTAVCKEWVGDQQNWDRIPESCAFAPYLPDIDYGHPDALHTMVEDAIWWAKEYDLDGFRVDAVKHMPHSVPWNLEVRVRNELEHRHAGGDTQFWTVGETFDGTERIQAYITREGRPQLDGQFDFPLYYAINSAFGSYSISLRDLESATYGSLAAWGPDALMSSFLGNHDVNRYTSFNAEGWQSGCEDDGVTPRNAWYVDNGNIHAGMRLAWTYLFTQPQVPLIYYGDEVGMPGYHDPDNRQPLEWYAGDVSGGAVESVNDMATAVGGHGAYTVDHVGKLGRARREHPGMWRGEMVQWWLEDDVWGYARVDPDTGDSTLTLINRSWDERWLTNGATFAGLPSDGTMEDVLTGETFAITGDSITVNLAGLTSRVLVLK